MVLIHDALACQFQNSDMQIDAMRMSEQKWCSIPGVFPALDPPALGLFHSCCSRSSSEVPRYFKPKTSCMSCQWWYQVASSGHSSRVQFNPKLELLSMWSYAYFPTCPDSLVSSYFPKLATLSVDEYMNVFPWCPKLYGHPIKGSQDRLHIHCDVPQANG